MILGCNEYLSTRYSCKEMSVKPNIDEICVLITRILKVSEIVNHKCNLEGQGTSLLGFTYESQESSETVMKLLEKSIEHLK